MRFKSSTPIYQKTILLMAFAAFMMACNKDLPVAEPIEQPEPQGQSIGEIINTDTSYSFLKSAVVKAGLTDALADATRSYTLFAPDNNAFRTLLTFLGYPPVEATIDALPNEVVKPIIQYHLIGGQALGSAKIPASFPNIQEPTSLVLSAPFFTMSLFPSKQGTNIWANNIPVTRPDQQASNGVIHGIPGVLIPPDKVIAQITGADTSLSFLMAAVARADSGQTEDLSKFSYLLAYPPTNFTLFAPSNNAFRALLTFLGLPPVEAAFNFIPVQTVRGIVAYHLLGTRAFGINIPETATQVPTLLQVAPSVPPIPVVVQRAGATVTVLGNGNGGFPATVVTKDLLAVNGIIHKINMVLLPQ